ncbi:LamG-like jellyroll fold domain-containing protein [Sorangium sp. So ce131]|uniref:LamG-like jellyroll fold domain-containing protein n=1 Tax=Sorangium sp. So ce131 TaxID=3133282 RepID=UPI003F5E2CFC
MRNFSFGLAHPLVTKTSSAAVLALLALGAAACGSHGVGDGSFGDAELTLDGADEPAHSASAVSASGDSGGDGAGDGDGAAGLAAALEEAPQPLGFWPFDECDGSTTELFDATGNGATATRSTGAACAQGISGLGISFDNSNDTVTVNDDARFTFGQNLAVAAWVNPTSVSGSTTRTIVQERNTSSSSFSLVVQNNQARFSVTLNNGRTVTASAAIQANVWTHVAGIYDGTRVRIFLNGQQAGQASAAGAIRDINAPIHIGNNPQRQRFAGVIDQVWLSASPLTDAQIAQLICLRHRSTVVVTPESSGPVAAGTPVTYQVSVTNNDTEECSPRDYGLNITGQPGISFSLDPSAIRGVEPGSTATFPVTLTGNVAVDPGVYLTPYEVINPDSPDGFFVASGNLTYEMGEPAGCFVRTGREIFVKHLSVVEDPIRTTFDGPTGDPRTGAWTFARLMEDMAPTPADAPAMVEQLFSTWLTDQAVNGFTVPARPAIQQVVFDEWPRSPDGSLDLRQAPLMLLGIVNRIDVRNLDQGHAGEGRFVFGVFSQGFPQQFTVILEYKLPASTEADVLQWANDWHALGSLPFPSEQYNAALQAITTRFAGRSAAPGKPNGSSLGQLRTNEIALAGPWELREFVLSPTTGFLQPATVKLTPDLSFDGTAELAAFVNANQASIIAEQHTVPDQLNGVPFLAGSSINNLTAWTAPGILDNEARHKFSLNTCNGCHGVDETGTPFLHVNPRNPGRESALSGFMTGIEVADFVSREPRQLNDLARRNQDLRSLVCGPAPTFARTATATAERSGVATSRSAFIRRGIGRVH